MNIYMKKTCKDKNISVWKVYMDDEGFTFRNIHNNMIDKNRYKTLLELFCSFKGIEEYFEIKAFKNDQEAIDEWLNNSF